MYSKFTEKARLVLRLAQEEAVRLKHGYIGTEHLLLGVVQEGQGIAARALVSLGITAETVYDAVQQLIGEGTETTTAVSYTPRAKKAIELAVQESIRNNHNYIGTEHILLGLIAEGEGIAAQIMTGYGADEATLRQRITDMLNGSFTGSASGAAKQPTSPSVETPLLDEYGRDLNKMALEGKIDPIIGRNMEIERVLQIISRRTKNNPVLIGEPGVGKTAIAEGLAQRIAENRVPEPLRGKRVVSLNLASVIAGSKYRGEFEERMRKIIDEIRGAGNIIVFIDELHTLIGAGAAEGAIDAANILKPALARGEIQIVGATTLDEYKKHVEKDAALERRFQPIIVGEPSEEDAIKILLGIRDKFEAFHRAQITDDAIEAAVRLSHRYIADRFLPDKAIDVMDEAASRARLAAFSIPPDVKDVEKELEALRAEKEAAIAGQEFEKAAELRDREQEIREAVENKQREWKQKGNERIVVNEDDIAHIVATWTGIPVKKLAQEESERLLRLEEILHSRVIGQHPAVQAVAKAVRRARAGLKDPKRPIGSFIFLGPTGVGKTELARALAEALFDSETNMIRLDMSEYMEKHTVSRLVGAPPGYVGYEEGGQLTDAVRRKPYSVILLDEIEKAHNDVFNMLLQVLEDGRLTDSQGRTVDFKNTVIIMTSNVGAQHLKKEAAALGFLAAGKHENSAETGKNRVLEEVKRTFRPEFINRIDELVVFSSLAEEELRQIVDLMLKDVAKRLKEQGFLLDITDAAKQLILKRGHDPVYGARPLRRAIQKMVEDEISELLLRRTSADGRKIIVDAGEGEELSFRQEELTTMAGN